MKKPLSFLATYRQHNLFLLAVAVFLGIVIYSFSIRRTVSVYQTYQRNKGNIEKAASAPSAIARYEKEWASLQQTRQRTYNREYLLDQLTTFCRTHELLIKSFPQALQQEKNQISVYTNHIELEGKYKDIVELIFMIEQEQHLATVSSVKFYTLKDRIDKQTYLRAKLVLRNLGA
ncbi:MAG: hypothetical protein AB8G15_03720 [Saprospiraceae bacterium]